MSDLVELPVPPITEDSFAIAANATHAISILDYTSGRQDLPGGAKILKARVDNGSNSDLRERQRDQPVRAGGHPTVRYPRGSTNVVLEEQDGFAVASGEIVVELTLGIDPDQLTPRQRRKWGIVDA